jgi:ribosomal protein S17
MKANKKMAETKKPTKKSSSQEKAVAKDNAGRGINPRGRTFVGVVESDRMSKTVIVTWQRRFFVKKFERYERRQSKVAAHNPESMNAKKGDIVKIQETRPLSKTKNFIVIEIIGQASAKEVVKTETIELETEREQVARARDEKKAKATAKDEE